MVKHFSRQFGKYSDVFIDVFILHPQLVKFCCSTIWFIHVGPEFNNFFFKVLIDHSVWSGRSRNGQDPVLRALFSFVDIWSVNVGEGMGHFLPWIRHDGMCSIHKLVMAKFVEEFVGLLSVSIEDRGFFSLEGFFNSSGRVRGCWDP